MNLFLNFYNEIFTQQTPIMMYIKIVRFQRLTRTSSVCCRAIPLVSPRLSVTTRSSERRQRPQQPTCKMTVIPTWTKTRWTCVRVTSEDSSRRSTRTSTHLYISQQTTLVHSLSSSTQRINPPLASISCKANTATRRLGPASSPTIGPTSCIRLKILRRSWWTLGIRRALSCLKKSRRSSHWGSGPYSMVMRMKATTVTNKI